MGRFVSFKTAQLAANNGFDKYADYKYNTEGNIVHHDNGTNIFAPDLDELQLWLEEKGMYISLVPEFYADGINWNWQILWYTPKSQWKWVNIGNDEDGKPTQYPENIMSGTGFYGDNGEYPNRFVAMDAALQMALMKLNIYYKHNSIDKLSQLYEMGMNDLLTKIRPFAEELGDWSFNDLTPEQLLIIVNRLGEPKGLSNNGEQ